MTLYYSFTFAIVCIFALLVYAFVVDIRRLTPVAVPRLCPVCKVNHLPDDIVYCCDKCAACQDDWSVVINIQIDCPLCEEHKIAFGGEHKPVTCGVCGETCGCYIGPHPALPSVCDKCKVSQTEITEYQRKYAQYPNGLQLNEEHEWLTVEQCREFARVNGYAYMVYKDEVMCVHEDDKSCGLCNALMCDVDLDTKDLRILNTLSATKTPWLHECISNTTYYGNYITWFEQRSGEGEKQVTKQYYQVLNKAMKHKRVMDILNK